MIAMVKLDPRRDERARKIDEGLSKIFKKLIALLEPEELIGVAFFTNKGYHVLGITDEIEMQIEDSISIGKDFNDIAYQ